MSYVYQLFVHGPMGNIMFSHTYDADSVLMAVRELQRDFPLGRIEIVYVPED